MKHKIPQKQIEVWLDTESESAHLKGVMTCGSVWVCPVCAAKIMMGRRAELLEGLEKASAQGLKVVFVTLTASHSRGDALADNLRKSKAALRFMRKTRAWRNFAARWLLVGQIDALEVTWGFNAGWHVHLHSLYFFSGDVNIQAIENQIYEQWKHALERQNMTCNRQNGVKALPANERAAEYITKWGLELELTSKEKVGKGDNFSPFQLVALYDEGYDWAGALFQEYGYATKGLSALRWGRGLREKLGMGQEVTDEELADEKISEHSIRLVTLTEAEYNRLLYTGRPGILGELLVVAERGREPLLLWLSLWGIHPAGDG